MKVKLNSVLVDIQEEHERVSARGVRFTMKPTETECKTIAAFDDTCGSSINMHQL